MDISVFYYLLSFSEIDCFSSLTPTRLFQVHMVKTRTISQPDED